MDPSVSILKWAGLICKLILFRLRIIQNFPERLGTSNTRERHSPGWSMVLSTTPPPPKHSAFTSAAMPRFIRGDMRGGGSQPDGASGERVG